MTGISLNMVDCFISIFSLTEGVSLEQHLIMNNTYLSLDCFPKAIRATITDTPTQSIPR